MAVSRQSNKDIKSNFSNVLFLALIAVTSFMVGSQYRISSQVSAPVSQGTDLPSNDVIAELQSALNNQPTSPDNGGVQVTEKATQKPPQAKLVNINTASAAELETLPGIGPSYAKAIIDYRTQNGPFVRLEDIQQVKGIGPKTFEKIRDKITL